MGTVGLLLPAAVVRLRHRGVRGTTPPAERGLLPAREASARLPLRDVQGREGHPRQRGNDACALYASLSSGTEGRREDRRQRAGRRVLWFRGRPGDVAACYADSTLANRELRWEAKRGIDEMCADAWRWQQNQAEIKWVK